MLSSFIQRYFTRKVSVNRSYIAAADGIRCLAITHVIFGHIFVFLNGKSIEGLQQSNFQILISSFFASPGLGLNIFFVLSGFLLVIPFANYYIGIKSKPSLLEYYLRRIIRLELPYFIALTFSSFMLVFVVHKFNFIYLFPRYISSIFYSNHLIYNVHAEPLPIAWSLETEVQFYILLPIFALIFKCKKILRRSILLVLVFILPYFISIYPFLYKVYFFSQCQYFFAGILAADVYLSKDYKNIPTTLSTYIGILLFSLICWFIPIFSTSFLTDALLYPICIAALIYLIIAHHLFAKIFTNTYVKTIGIMSYTIYLWHYMIISGVMTKTIQIKIGKNFIPNLLLQSLICVPIIILLSSIFYIFIERPCMYATLSKKWANYLKKRLF